MFLSMSMTNGTARQKAIAMVICFILILLCSVEGVLSFRNVSTDHFNSPVSHQYPVDFCKYRFDSSGKGSVLPLKQTNVKSWMKFSFVFIQQILDKSWTIDLSLIWTHGHAYLLLLFQTSNASSCQTSLIRINQISYNGKRSLLEIANDMYLAWQDAI